MNNSNIDHQKSGNLSTDELTSSSTSTINEVRGKSFKYFITIVLACTVIFLICQIIVYLGFREHRKSLLNKIAEWYVSNIWICTIFFVSLW